MLTKDAILLISTCNLDAGESGPQVHGCMVAHPNRPFSLEYGSVTDLDS